MRMLEACDVPVFKEFIIQYEKHTHKRIQPPRKTWINTITWQFNPYGEAEKAAVQAFVKHFRLCREYRILNDSLKYGPGYDCVLFWT